VRAARRILVDRYRSGAFAVAEQVNILGRSLAQALSTAAGVVDLKIQVSGQLADAQAAYLLEVLGIAGHQAQLVLDRGRCDEGIWSPDAGLVTYSAGAFGDSAAYWKLAERFQQGADYGRGRGAGKELAPSDHRNVHEVIAGAQFGVPSKVVDEHIGVHQQVSHDPTRHG